jgi:hypothetical protein
MVNPSAALGNAEKREGELHRIHLVRMRAIDVEQPNAELPGPLPPKSTPTPETQKRPKLNVVIEVAVLA